MRVRVLQGRDEREGTLLIQQWLPAIRVIQIILSIAVIAFILLQVRSAGLGSAFGGTSAGSVFKTRRGVERLVFNITIVFIVLFGVISLLSAALIR
jgi:preprotein translocase subunit SecG